MVLLICFNVPNSSSRAIALEFSQLITEVGTRNIPEGDEARPARNTENLTAIYRPLCRKCGILDVIQRDRHQRPVCYLLLLS
jgi:hypothetical protein